MTALIPGILLFVLVVFLFFREEKLERKRFLEEHRLADEHVLREIERFLKEQESTGKLAQGKVQGG
jgi:hypothetical protein